MVAERLVFNSGETVILSVLYHSHSGSEFQECNVCVHAHVAHVIVISIDV